jgi:uncharacterized protein (UPF0332 family)
MDESSRLAIRDHLASARSHLDHARAIAGIGIHDIAAREGYQSAFHTAQAVLLARTGRRAKTHSGLRAILAKLAAESDDINLRWAKFLAQTYDLKSKADYGTKTGIVSEEDARSAMDGAEHMLAEVTRMLIER